MWVPSFYGSLFPGFMLGPAEKSTHDYSSVILSGAMDWRATVAVSVVVGLGTGVAFAKEYDALRATTKVAVSANGASAAATIRTNEASFPDVARARRGPADPAFELLASNPYEAVLAGYKTALNLDGEHPFLEDPYSETMLFTNPYERSLGIANPYVDAIRKVDGREQARLDNPYTERLRDAASVNLDNPYSRRR